MSKPQVTFEIRPDQGAKLSAAGRLKALPDTATYHVQRDLRHPLGTYNASVLRVCDRITRCASRYEDYFRSLTDLKSEQNNRDKQTDFVDYLELLIYSAAEHVDDLEAILDTLFRSKRDFSKSPVARKFKIQHKILRDRLSSYANAIKHSQSRIRVYSADFDHGGNRQIFHGIFFEGYSQGTLGPSVVLHQGDRRIFSVNSLLWESLIFLTQSSDLVVEAIDILVPNLPNEEGYSEVLKKAVVATARLPIYSFDENHPFERVSVTIDVGDISEAGLKSDLYGSLYPKWTSSKEGQVLGTENGYVGDGVTRSFKIVDPKALRLQHWG